MRWRITSLLEGEGSLRMIIQKTHGEGTFWQDGFCDFAFGSAQNDRLGGIRGKSDLFISEINTGGIPDTQKRTLILDINFNQKHFERMIHHEIFHMIQSSHQNYFDEELFSNLNEPNFTYAECSTCSDRLNLDLYENTKGFLTEYSKSIPSEDMAEIFSFLMTNKSKVNEITQKDNILKNKVELIKSGLSKIDNDIL